VSFNLANLANSYKATLKKEAELHKMALLKKKHKKMVRDNTGLLTSLFTKKYEPGLEPNIWDGSFYDEIISSIYEHSLGPIFGEMRDVYTEIVEKEGNI